MQNRPLLRHYMPASQPAPCSAHRRDHGWQLLGEIFTMSHPLIAFCCPYVRVHVLECNRWSNHQWGWFLSPQHWVLLVFIGSYYYGSVHYLGIYYYDPVHCLVRGRNSNVLPLSNDILLVQAPVANLWANRVQPTLQAAHQI